jgi:hypothetical protein
MNARAAPDDTWLYIFRRIGNLGDFSSENRMELLRSLLQLNMVVIGIKIALNDDNYIVLMSSTNNIGLTSGNLTKSWKVLILPVLRFSFFLKSTNKRFDIVESTHR